MAALGIVLLASSPSALAETLLSSAEEKRLVLGFELDEETVLELLPEGWRPSPETAGAHQGANFLLVLADQGQFRTIGGSAGRETLALIATVPARDGGFPPGYVIVGGFIEPHAAPGEYGVFEPAEIVVEYSASNSASDGETHEWRVVQDDGVRFSLQIDFERQNGRMESVRSHTYSRQDTTIQRAHRYEEETVVLFSRSLDVDAIAEIEMPSTDLMPGLSLSVDKLVSVVWMPRAEVETYRP